MRRTDREITDRARIEQIIRSSDVCHVAFSDTPHPYVLPLNFVYLDGCLYFHCARDGRKIDLIAADPHVAWEVDRQIDLIPADQPCGWGIRYESVAGTGIASILTDEAEKAKALTALMTRYSGKTDWTFSHEQLGSVTVVRIQIAEMTGKNKQY